MICCFFGVGRCFRWFYFLINVSISVGRKEDFIFFGLGIEIYIYFGGIGRVVVNFAGRR